MSNIKEGEELEVICTYVPSRKRKGIVVKVTPKNIVILKMLDTESLNKYNLKMVKKNGKNS